MAEIRKIVFFGTPLFAVPTLDAVTDAGYRPSLVVTQPSRRSGRGRRVQPPPVCLWARAKGVEVLQPGSVKKIEFIATMRAFQPDLAVVVAFGQIFPKKLLEIPVHGCLNLHASLLPAYRGASPIAAAIAAGESETGVSTMWMEEGMDSGPVLLQRRVSIAEGETTGELSPRLAKIGGDLVVETLRSLEEGLLEEQQQDASHVSFAPKLGKPDGVLDWNHPAQMLANRVRALDPWPGARTRFRGKELRIHRVRLPTAGAPDDREASTDKRRAGSYLGRDKEAALVGCGDGTSLALVEVQRSGRKVVRGVDFINAERPQLGELFGDPSVR